MSLIGVVLLTFLLLVGCSSNPSTSGSDSSSTEETTNSSVAENKETQKILAQIETDIMKQLPDDIKIKKNLKIGVLIISTTNPFWANMEKQYQQAGKDLGIEVEVVAGTTEDDKVSQMEALSSMVAKNYDAVIVSPIDGNNLIPAIVQLNEAKIPVINLGPGVDETVLAESDGHLDGKITVNFEEQGKLVVEDLAQRLDNQGEVAILEGLSGAGQSEGRTTGATEAIAEIDGLELVASQPCDWDATKAYEATETIIKENPEIKAIFACNDTMALAASEALQSNQMEDVLVYGVDGTKDALKAIEAGEMTGSVTYSSKIYTKAALLMAAAISDGAEFSKPVYSPLVLITPETAEAYANWE